MFRVLGYEYLNRSDLVHVIDDVPTGTLVEHATNPHELAHPVGRDHRESALGSGAPEAMALGVTPVPMKSRIPSEQPAYDPRNEHAGHLMGDAPACDTCGHTTIRNGTCYKCTNCGNSMGCS